MKNIKRLILPLTFFTFTSFYSGNFHANSDDSLNKTANELGIGEFMPRLKGKAVLFFKDTYTEIFDIYSDKNEYLGAQAYLICNGKKMDSPFLVEIYRNKIMYIDNKDKKDKPFSDGLIDEKFIIKENSNVMTRVPKCLPKI